MFFFQTAEADVGVHLLVGSARAGRRLLAGEGHAAGGLLPEGSEQLDVDGCRHGRHADGQVPGMGLRQG